MPTHCSKLYQHPTTLEPSSNDPRGRHDHHQKLHTPSQRHTDYLFRSSVVVVVVVAVVVERASVVAAEAVQRWIVVAAVGVAAEIRQNLWSVDCRKWRWAESDFEKGCW